MTGHEMRLPNASPSSLAAPKRVVDELCSDLINCAAARAIRWLCHFGRQKWLIPGKYSVPKYAYVFIRLTLSLNKFFSCISIFSSTSFEREPQI